MALLGARISLVSKGRDQDGHEDHAWKKDRLPPDRSPGHPLSLKVRLVALILVPTVEDAYGIEEHDGQPVPKIACLADLPFKGGSDRWPGAMNRGDGCSVCWVLPGHRRDSLTVMMDADIPDQTMQARKLVRTFCHGSATKAILAKPSELAEDMKGLAAELMPAGKSQPRLGIFIGPSPVPIRPAITPIPSPYGLSIDCHREGELYGCDSRG